MHRTLAFGLLALAAFGSTSGAARAASPGPCDDLDTPAGAEACVQAFIADPSGPPSLGDHPGNFFGVGHRLGDLGFIVAHGRRPTAADSEDARMRAHFALAARILRARPATSPALAARRAHILDLVDTYRDKGSVPMNDLVGERRPVFIDEAGTICAVGYLIEQTAGRDLAETVAARFRTSYVDEMHGLPALDAWVAGSGFTAAELALVQPAYSLPPLDQSWRTFVGPLRMGVHADDGPFALLDGWHRTTRGAWKRGHMDGHWERRDAAGALIGSGDFKAGAGDWRAFDASGALVAEGRVARDAPNGAWRAYYPSGRLAVDGAFDDGIRSGEWSYYFDAPGQVLMARGRYQHDEVGKWEHYDRLGRHIATSDTGHGAVLWYDPDGALRAADSIAGIDGQSLGDGVEWGRDGLVRRERVTFEGRADGSDFSSLELGFDDAGHLASLVARMAWSGKGIVVALADGRVRDAWLRDDDTSDAPVDLHLAADALAPRLLSRFVAEAERGAKDHRKGPTPLAPKRLVAAATPVLAFFAAAGGSRAPGPASLATALADHDFVPSFPASEAVAGSTRRAMPRASRPTSAARRPRRPTPRRRSSATCCTSRPWSRAAPTSRTSTRSAIA
ncbi:MAG: hypothetical protein U1F43_06390 [Myxococcota bacterium]